MGKFAVQQFLLLALPLLHLAAPPANAAAIDALRSAAAAAGHSLDAWCMAYSCPGQSYACAVNSDCRACLTCLHSCGGSGDTCSAACLYRCRAEQLLTDFLTCAVTEHNCVELSLGPPATLAEADGLWLAVRGGHPFHDCHPCRGELLEAEAGQTTGGFLFEGSPVKLQRRVVAAWPENGTLLLGLTKVGQAVTEAWRLSWPSEEARGQRLMLSYCGSAAGAWRYRGRLELRRRAAGLGAGQRLSPSGGGFACSVRLEGDDCRQLWRRPAEHDADEL
uniref:VDE domain-containing protein n=1 Tax=Macrostomum lignano TaxID=282301 RepID=A0A1I8G4Z2_9PLAT